MPKRKRASWPSIALLSALLSGCATAHSSGCPPLVAYPREFTARAASEYGRLPKGAALKTLITDYGKMRDACRAVAAR